MQPNKDVPTKKPTSMALTQSEIELPPIASKVHSTKNVSVFKVDTCKAKNSSKFDNETFSNKVEGLENGTLRPNSSTSIKRKRGSVPGIAEDYARKENSSPSPAAQPNSNTHKPLPSRHIKVPLALQGSARCLCSSEKSLEFESPKNVLLTPSNSDTPKRRQSKFCPSNPPSS